MQIALKTIFAKIGVRMTENDFLSLANFKVKKEGKITWRSPSNIALVKYWGKRDNQIPANPSISFTLDVCATTTTVSYTQLAQAREDFSFELLFEGASKPDFEPKIKQFFSRIYKYLPFLKEYHFSIETSNSFPHSSGIASSASGMSALALCLMTLEKDSSVAMTDDFFNKKASFLARLGSGSACRSMEGNTMLWGVHQEVPQSSNLFAVKDPFRLHSVFSGFQDTILLVDKGKKQVSSSVGHDLMLGHPFANARFTQAHEHLSRLKTVFETGNLERFIEIVESEALVLHAMMMTANPYFILMKPNTLEIINKIWAFRQATQTPVCFTLDAGANVHILYPEFTKALVSQFIKDELVAYCENGQYICDQIGSGAVRLS